MLLYKLYVPQILLCFTLTTIAYDYYLGVRPCMKCVVDLTTIKILYLFCWPGTLVHVY